MRLMMLQGPEKILILLTLAGPNYNINSNFRSCRLSYSLTYIFLIFIL